MQLHDTTLGPNPSGLCMCGCGQLTPISKRNRPDGSVKGRPIRFIKGHWSKTQPVSVLTERFWEKVDKRGPDDCWEWMGSRNISGYGQISIGGKFDGTRHIVRASRVSYELTKGPIPDALFVLHKCDNPPCVNPDHLFPGTHDDNMADMVAKGRQRKPQKQTDTFG